MDFLIGMFLIGFWICVALFVFNLALYVFFGGIGLIVGLIGWIWEKFQDYRANRLQDAVNREIVRQNRLDGYDQNGNRND